MALALLGDSLLYVVLPLYAADFGVGLAWVGVLLSANRLIRVVAYGGVAAFGERIGPRRLTLIAGVLAAVSTLFYAIGDGGWVLLARSEEHTSELQSLMRISYAVFCLKKK